MWTVTNAFVVFVMIMGWVAARWIYWQRARRRRLRQDQTHRGKHVRIKSRSTAEVLDNNNSNRGQKNGTGLTKGRSGDRDHRSGFVEMPQDLDVDVDVDSPDPEEALLEQQNRTGRERMNNKKKNWTHHCLAVAARTCLVPWTIFLVYNFLNALVFFLTTEYPYFLWFNATYKHCGPVEFPCWEPSAH